MLKWSQFEVVWVECSVSHARLALWWFTGSFWCDWGKYRATLLSRPVGTSEIMLQKKEWTEMEFCLVFSVTGITRVLRLCIYVMTHKQTFTGICGLGIISITGMQSQTSFRGRCSVKSCTVCCNEQPRLSRPLMVNEWSRYRWLGQ